MQEQNLKRKWVYNIVRLLAKYLEYCLGKREVVVCIVYLVVDSDAVQHERLLLAWLSKLLFAF